MERIWKEVIVVRLGLPFRFLPSFTGFQYPEMMKLQLSYVFSVTLDLHLKHCADLWSHFGNSFHRP